MPNLLQNKLQEQIPTLAEFKEVLREVLREFFTQRLLEPLEDRSYAPQQPVSTNQRNISV